MTGYNNSVANERPKQKQTRKKFLILSALLLWTATPVARAYRALFAKNDSLQPRKARKISTPYDLAVVRGDDITGITRRAIEELGGIERFVKKNDIVVIKPNIGWNRTPEYAADTNPEIISTLIKMCRDAGAKRVRVFDNTCNTAKMCYHNSGIYDAVKQAGGDIYHVSDWKFLPGEFPRGSKMQSWPIFKDAVECDCFINVPIAKHHSLTGLTLSMKNLMGVCGGSRGKIHWDIDIKLAELTAFIKPDLTVIDAYRILLRHGPSGGNLNDVSLKKTVIAGTDPVLADAYAATLFGKDPGEIGTIVSGARHKLGSMDIAKANVSSVKI